MATKAKMVPKPTTMMRKLDEVEEYAGHVRELRRKLNRLTPGSDAYQELLADLWVNLDWLKLKAESAALMLDEYEESLPDDD
jgi:hypothetical protein